MNKEVLKIYIDEMIFEGYEIDQIKKNLINNGYSLELINELLPDRNIQIINYMKDNFEKGFNKEEIMHTLIISGYNLPELNQNFKFISKKEK
ncbi:hypothetical protein J4403_03110 [Candidatus Woesearchaeota archaeon]|nr:hypothetical protein [Candidatus Woesearchaeota archaeon]